MKHSLLTFVLALAVVSVIPGAAAAELTKTLTTAGTLATAVGSDTDATSLKVSGPVNAADLSFIGKKMTSLHTLDLSEARVEAYDGKLADLPQTSFAANELPALSLAGCPASTIILPAGLTAIGEGAMAGSGITTLTLPASVTRVDNGAFAGLPKLTTVNFPATVTSPGSGIFRGCTALTEATFEPTEVPAYTFAECTALQSVTLDHYTTEIGSWAFAGDSELSVCTISGNAWSLRSIGEHAFSGTSLQELDLSAQAFLTSIGAWAFSDCKKLTRLILPASVNEFGDGALFNAEELAEFSPIQPKRVGKAAFKGASKLNINAIGGNSAETWDDYAFYGMRSLTRVHLPDNLSYIGNHAFDGCTSLQLLNGPGIRQVPELGEDVWGDLDKSKVNLGVPEEMVAEFKATPVWNEFNILDKADTTSVVDDITDTESGLTATFDGINLTLSTTDNQTDIAAVGVYSPGGVRIHMSRPDSPSTVISAREWPRGVVIVSVELADGSLHTSKFVR